MASSSASIFASALSWSISSSRLPMPERFGAAFGEVGAALEQLELGERVLRCGCRASSRSPWRGSPRFRTGRRSHSGGRGLRAAWPEAWRCRLRSRAAPPRSGPSRRAGCRPFRRPSGARSARPWRGPRGPWTAPARPWRSSRTAISSSRPTRAAHFLDVGDRARRGRADLDQRLFHLEDDHPDHPRRVFRPVENLGDVRREDVAGPAEHRTAEPGWRPERAARPRSRAPSPARRADRNLGFEDFEFRH